MKAAQISEYGDPSVIQINDIDKPSPMPGQVLIKVRAASLNPFDSSVRNGYLRESIPLKLPVTLGGDLAGEVVELGEGVSGVREGDKVFGQAAVVAGNSGAFAEYAATAAGQLAKAPDNLDFKEAASLPLVGVAALQALTEHIKLRAGQKIFIHGGAGGIGTVAIQIAKSIGAYVATTATGEKLGVVKKLGADEIIDYKTQEFASLLRDYDAVFDTVGGDDFNKSLHILKRGGTAVSMTARADEAKAKELGVTTIAQKTHVTTQMLHTLKLLAESDKVKPQVGKVFKLKHIQEAFTTRENDEVSGKVVIEI